MPIPSQKETMNSLKKEKKHSIRIRADENNPNYKTEPVWVNGVCYQIPVGEEVEVPETVYNCLVKKGVI